MKGLLSRLKKVLLAAIRRIAAMNRVFCGLYYTFVSNRFRDEFFSIMKGIEVYRRKTADIHDPELILRRNIHRIEKGLSLRNRKSLFALSYIGETVEAFTQHRSEYENDPLRQTENNWARDVLTEYFSKVQSNPVVEEVKQLFLRATADDTDSPGGKKPGVLDRVHGIPEYQKYYDMCRQRKSVRTFRKKPVEREILDRAFDAARQAPSACNRQPFVFKVFETQTAIRRVLPYLKGTTGYEDEIPVLILVVGNQSAFFDERDRHLVYIDSSLSTMSLLLAFETLGLASCVINWPDLEEHAVAVRRDLGLELYERPILAVAVGYPDEGSLVPHSDKKPLDLLREYIQ
jgi:nitroreductase